MRHFKEFRERRQRNSGSQASAGAEGGNQQPVGQGRHRSRAKPKEPKDSSPESNELLDALPEDCKLAVLAELGLLTNKYLSPSRSILTQMVGSFPHDTIPIDRTIFDQRFVQLFGLPDPDRLTGSWSKTDTKAETGFKVCKPEEFTAPFQYPIRLNHEEVQRMENSVRRVCMHFSRTNHADKNRDDLIKVIVQALYYQFKLEQRELHRGINGFEPLTESRKRREKELEELSKPFWKVIETKMGIPKERLECAKLWEKAYGEYGYTYRTSCIRYLDMEDAMEEAAHDSNDTYSY